MQWKIFAISLVGLFGIYFLGRGITGLVVSNAQVVPDRIGGLDLLVGSTVLIIVLAFGYRIWQEEHRHHR